MRNKKVFFLWGGRGKALEAWEILRKCGKHLGNQRMVKNTEGLLHCDDREDATKISWGQVIYTVNYLFSTQIQPDEILLRRDWS